MPIAQFVEHLQSFQPWQSAEAAALGFLGFRDSVDVGAHGWRKRWSNFAHSSIAPKAYLSARGAESCPRPRSGAAAAQGHCEVLNFATREKRCLRGGRRRRGVPIKMLSLAGDGEALEVEGAGAGDGLDAEGDRWDHSGKVRIPQD